MQIVNEKSLLHALFSLMDKLDTGEITESKAIAQSKIASQAIKLFEIEQRRTIIEMKAAEISKELGRDFQIRELAAKGFDDTTKKFIDTTDYSQ